MAAANEAFSDSAMPAGVVPGGNLGVCFSKKRKKAKTKVAKSSYKTRCMWDG